MVLEIGLLRALHLKPQVGPAVVAVWGFFFFFFKTWPELGLSFPRVVVGCGCILWRCLEIWQIGAGEQPDGQLSEWLFAVKCSLLFACVHAFEVCGQQRRSAFHVHFKPKQEAHNALKSIPDKKAATRQKLTPSIDAKTLKPRGRGQTRERHPSFQAANTSSAFSPLSRLDNYPLVQSAPSIRNGLSNFKSVTPLAGCAALKQ